MSKGANSALAKARKAAGLYQAQLAQALGVSDSLVSTWESGKHDVPLKYKDALEKIVGNVDGIAFCTQDVIIQRRTRGDAPLARARIAKGITQEDLARRLGVSKQMITIWEHGLKIPENRIESLNEILECDLRSMAEQKRKSEAELSSALSDARKAAGLTQKQLADQLGVSRKTVREFEIRGSIPEKYRKAVEGILGVADGIDYHKLSRVSGSNRRSDSAFAMARERAGLSQAEVAGRLGISASLISYWETGRKTIPEKYREALEGLFGNVDGLAFYTPTDRITAVCVVCGRQFVPSSGTRHSTCSDECRSILLSETHFARSTRQYTDAQREAAKNSGRPDALRVGREVAMQLPGHQGGELHRRAKIWTLVDPSGNRYEVSNLHNWCRENAALFDMPPENAQNISAGFIAIAGWMRGTRKGKATSYKGWTLAGLPRIRELAVDLSTLTYPSFQNLRTESRNYPNTREGLLRLADYNGIVASEDVLSLLKMIRDSAEGGIACIRGVSGLTREEFADRYRLPLASVRAWETEPIGIPAWAERMLAYVVIIDKMQSNEKQEAHQTE